LPRQQGNVAFKNTMIVPKVDGFPRAAFGRRWRAGLQKELGLLE
jgi:hypothetical protein